jgi:elongator complex protein 3
MIQAYDNYIISAIERLPQTQEEFLQLKKSLSKQYKLPIPTNADMRDGYNKLVAKRAIKRSEAFEKILKTRGVRTQSGVAVVAVLTKPYPCPGNCLYCPTEKDMPKSYLSNEPAVMRAIDAKFDPYRQVQNRLRSLELNGHSTDKIELIVMGGTFSYLPKAYQKKFITECFRAANDYPEKVKSEKLKVKSEEKLEKEQKRNEKAKHRIIGLTLETRPDYINEEEILNFRNLGCTRVELGVQSIFDDVLRLNRRGHDVASTIQATKMLKDAGFKLNYHMMPGLPGSTPRRDFAMFKALFSKGNFQPDMLKIYPTVVLKDSDLYKIWKKSQQKKNVQKNEIIHLPTTVNECITLKNLIYKPLTDKQFEKLVLKIKNEAIVPYVRIARLVRDVPTTSIIAGPIISNLRQIIIPHSNCPCIRCREVKNEYVTEEQIILDRIDYDASDGKEIFLQYVSPDKRKLFALLRLRIPKRSLAPEKGAKLLEDVLPVLKNAAIIREVHTYGKLAKIDTKDKSSPQHIGLGKKLLKEAEHIAKEEFGLKKIVVISGVGVRGYYRKNGYRLQDTYMVKTL